MWEVVAVMVPLVVSINAVIFKRLDDLDKNLASLGGGFVSREELSVKFESVDSRLSEIADKLDRVSDRYVSRTELNAKFEALENKLAAVNDRVNITRDLMTARRVDSEVRSEWYESRRVPRRDEF